jgi:dipeptidyl aminopeptidase/acylaminoacyl peptidase
LASKDKVSIKVRDGLQLPGYLTLPRGVEPKNLPMVLLVHGGPQSNDSGDFDTWPQFLANRGYAVLQVNFRGSAGFGHELMSAGLKRWGREMQDDLADATQWAIARGTADPRRICIVGASYGGYAALMGVAKMPDLYRCAFSFAGVTDVYELGRDQGNYTNKEVFDKQIGSLELERDRLKAISPVTVAKQIKVPVLLMHGTQDRSVVFYQGAIMDEALTAAGVPHRFVKQDLGDHNLSIYQHRLQFFTELEKFLAENLGVPNR